MNLEELSNSLQQALGSTIPNLLGALAILVFGWLIAFLARAGTRKGLALLRLDARIQSGTGKEMSVERTGAGVVYYVILLLVLIAFFNALNLEYASESLRSVVDQIIGYLPKLLAGGVLLLVAWIIATLLRTIVSKALLKTGIDERLTEREAAQPISRTLSNVLYWLVILLFLPAVLGALQLQGLITPVQGMVDDILAMLPNILAAVAIAVFGWFVARILRDVVANLLGATGLDEAGKRAGMKGTMTLSGLIGLTVYVLVLVSALIAAMNALQIEAISDPAIEMLGILLSAVPNLFGAAILLTIAWFLARLVASLVENLLGGIAFDSLPEKLGLGHAFEKGLKPSELVGRIVLFFILLFAVVEAASLMGFEQVSDIVSTLIGFGGQVLLGIVIIAAGLWIANLARDAVQRVGGEDAGFLAAVARFAVLVIAFAMGLRAMGLADDIVNLAFGITLGAAAVAVAIAFGIGGREAASRQIDRWLKRLQS